MKERSAVGIYWFSLALAVVANVFYHVFQKQTPAGAPPMLALTVTYLTAGVACLAVYALFPGPAGFTAGFRALNWTSAVLGVTIIFLELGFLLAYRYGGNVNTAALLVNTAVAVLLVPVGIALFREGFKPIHAAGMALCLVGLFLMTRK